MRENVERIISVEFSEIQKSGELTLLLLSTYSYLYLGGSAPGTCGKCMQDFYIKIVNEGLQKIDFMEKKTNILVEGLHYVRPRCMHYSNNNLSDELAIELLNEGLLKESQFRTLPAGYEYKKIELEESNKGKFNEDNLNEWDADSVKLFAELISGDAPSTKKKAIEIILAWNKAE